MATVLGDLATGWSTAYRTVHEESYNTAIAVQMAQLSGLLTEIDLADHQGTTVTLDWLGAAPQMQTWVAEKKTRGFNRQTWSANVQNYSASTRIDLNVLRDARGNVYGGRIREMSENAARLPYNLISDLIVGGATALCYDGQYFFDTDHSEGDSGTQSNKLTGAGTSQANIETDFYAAYAALLGFKDDAGVAMAPSDFTPIVWIPVNATLDQRFSTLQGATVISQTSNVLANKFRIIRDPRLTDTNDWYMFRPSSGTAPFVWGWRETPNYEDNFDSGSDEVFQTRIGTASVVARALATYGMWQSAVKVVN
ncbi:MAG: hypothetical protein FJX77_02200 [Armatimonadetes bacterium]|nr:hypothetical protein [Armatimonadota bacterium]